MFNLDFETYCEVPIEHGTYVYAESAEVMIATYAHDGDAVQLWDKTLHDSMPGDLGFALKYDDCPIRAHSSMFDRNITKYALGIDVPIPRWRDSMVQALAHSLPGGLDKLCQILKVPLDQAKQQDGRKLIHLFCKPQAATAKVRRATRITHPEAWRRFCAYAVADITAMRECVKRLPDWNYKNMELDLWHLDQAINDRGFAVDLELVEAAIRATRAAQHGLSLEMQDSTEGAVMRATQRDKLILHIVESYGVVMADLTKDTIERRIDDPELPEAVRELLRIRLQASMASTSKYAALKRGTNKDGRMRGTIQFDGAQRTGRAAGRGFQPQNLPSRGVLPSDQIARGIDCMKLGMEHLAFDNVMRLGASAIRGCVIAPPDKKLVVSDLSNIEGRYAAWLAGEEWKLQAFRDYDAGVGEDLYRLSYAKAFNIPVADVDGGKAKGPMRQIGKVSELMLQYQGGVGAWITGAETYGIDLDEMAAAAKPALPADVWEEAADMYEWCLKEQRPTFGLAPDTFRVCDSLKRLWRRAHPAIVSLWGDLEDAVRQAIGCPGETFVCRKFKVRRDGAWLRIGMPSGRSLCYPTPMVTDRGIYYMGVSQYTKQWSRIGTYGGKLKENLTQAGARDILYHAMPRAEAEGYAIVLHVHDELICEVPDTDEYNEARLSEILAEVPAWAEGLPLAAAGFESYRYRKDD